MSHNELILSANILNLIETSIARGEKMALPVRIKELIGDAPSGLQAERECLCFERFAGRPWSECPSCHGSGKILRDLTDKEALEWAKEILNNRHQYLYNYDVLPSGEIVVVKEGK